MGPIVVTGASGGVGTVAIDLLTQAGYEVHAITGKVDEFDWLEHLGARSAFPATICTGGKNLWKNQLGRLHRQRGWRHAGRNRSRHRSVGQHRLLRHGRRPWPEYHGFPDDTQGGQPAGHQFRELPIDMRRNLWNRLGQEWKPPHLDEIITQEVTLDTMETVFNDMMEGRSLGRTVVKIGDIED